MAELTLPASARCFKALHAMVLPLPLLPPFGREDNTCSTNTNSSPTASTHTDCGALKASAYLDWPLPAGPTDSKDGKGNDDGGDNNSNASGSNQELDCTPD